MKRDLDDTERVLQIARPTMAVFFLLLVLVRFKVPVEILASLGLLLLILGIWTVARFVRQIWHNVRKNPN